MNIKKKKIFPMTVLFATLLISCTHSKIEYRTCEKGCVEFKTTYVAVDTLWGEPQTVEEIRAKELREMRWAEEQKWINSIQKSSKEVFLVNSSSNNRYTFTVKIIENSKNQIIRTRTFQLNPGAQALIECDKFVMDNAVVDRTFEIVGEVKNQ